MLRVTIWLTILCVAHAVSTAEIGAQVHQDWVARYDGPANGEDLPKDMSVDSAGNVYVTGHSHGVGTGLDYATVKYSPAGVELWSKRYNGPSDGDDGADAVAVDDLGNVYVVGFSQGPGDRFDRVTIKYDGSGNELWVSRYVADSFFGTGFFDVAVDDLGNVYVTGNDDDDMVTIKYDDQGNELWIHTHAGGAAGALVLDSQSNAYVTGIGELSSGYVTIKISSTGSEQWASFYSGGASAGGDWPVAIALDPSDNVLVTGTSSNDGPPANGSDYATVKYDNNGNELWVVRFDRGSHENTSDLAVDGAGNVYVTGLSWGGTLDRQDYATVKYNSAGVEQWSAVYQGGMHIHDWPHSMAVDDSGNVYVAGHSGPVNLPPDFLTLKYDSSGNQLWLARYTASATSEDIARVVKVDSSGNTVVAGESDQLGTALDFATVRYAPGPGPEFRRGDCNNDGSQDIADAVTLLSYLFPQPGEPPSLDCDDACDANDDGALDIADPVAIFASLFGEVTIPLPPPYPGCGVDPTDPEGLTCDLYDHCP